MANLFMLGKEDDLTQCVIGQGLEDEICAAVHVGGNCLCPRAVPLEQYFQAFARHTRPGGKTFDLASHLIGLTWIAASATDRKLARMFLARQTQMSKRLVSHLF